MSCTCSTRIGIAGCICGVRLGGAANLQTYQPQDLAASQLSSHQAINAGRAAASQQKPESKALLDQPSRLSFVRIFLAGLQPSRTPEQRNQLYADLLDFVLADPKPKDS